MRGAAGPAGPASVPSEQSRTGEASRTGDIHGIPCERESREPKPGVPRRPSPARPCRSIPSRRARWRPARPVRVRRSDVIAEQDRPWLVRCPRTLAAGARLESAAALAALLARRLPFQVPVLKGFAALPDGRAGVYPVLPGRPGWRSTRPGRPGLAAGPRAAIAMIHNVDRGVFDEAGMPSYDADYRTSTWPTLIDSRRHGACPHGLAVPLGGGPSTTPTLCGASLRTGPRWVDWVAGAGGVRPR